MFWRSKKDKSKEKADAKDKSKRKSRDSSDSDQRNAAQQAAVPTNRHEIEAVLGMCSTVPFQILITSTAHYYRVLFWFKFTVRALHSPRPLSVPLRLGYIFLRISTKI